MRGLRNIPVVIQDCTVHVSGRARQKAKLSGGDVRGARPYDGQGEQITGTHNETPFEGGEELALEDVELCELDPPDLGIVAVRAEGIAQCLGGDADRGNKEPVDGEGGDGESREPTAHLVDIMKSYQQACLLKEPQ